MQIESWNSIFFNDLFNSSALYRPDIVLNSKISLWRGDITKLNIDCIVNVASKNLEGGGGLDAAIHKGHLGLSCLMHVRNFSLITKQIIAAKLVNVK